MGRWAKWEATDTARSNMQGLPSRSESVLCLVAQSCPTLCDPVDCSPPGSSLHGILQARVLEWVVFPFFRVSSQARDQIWVS